MTYFIAKNSFNFFQRFTFSLRVGEKGNDNEDDATDQEDQEKSPRDVVESQWRYLSQHDQDTIENSVVGGDTHSTDGGGAYLGRILRKTYVSKGFLLVSKLNPEGRIHSDESWVISCEVQTLTTDMNAFIGPP
jgi:hypothetical protein